MASQKFSQAHSAVRVMTGHDAVNTKSWHCNKLSSGNALSCYSEEASTRLLLRDEGIVNQA